MDGLMSIGEFSAKSGLSARRLRSYAVAGLLVPAAIDPDSAYRYYAAGQLPEAHLIDVLRQAGLPLSEIKVVLRERRVGFIDKWAAQVRVDADHKQRALARARELLSTDDREAAGMEVRGAANLRLEAAGRTETGPVRESNEDTIVVSDNLVAVADGMGGHAAGELASTLATTAVAAIFTGKSQDELETAVRAANWVVWERAGKDPALRGMGTTFCAVGVVEDGTVAIANVGDSRVYLARDRSLRSLTDDHTVAHELVRQGKLSPEEADQHPQRRFLTRALGAGAEVVIDTMRLELADGDRLLLCSDGVFTVASDEELAELLLASESPQAAAEAIVERALANGSDDNASAVAAFATSQTGVT